MFVTTREENVNKQCSATRNWRWCYSLRCVVLHFGWS